MSWPERGEEQGKKERERERERERETERQRERPTLENLVPPSYQTCSVRLQSLTRCRLQAQVCLRAQLRV